MDLTNVQWAVLEPTFRPRRRLDGRGRPWTDSRAVMNGVLWVLRTGAPWHDLPSRYPPYQTCHRRFQLWQRSGRLDRLLQRLAEDLRDRGKIDLSEAFVDATFASAKSLRLCSGPVHSGVAFADEKSRNLFNSPGTSNPMARLGRRLTSGSAARHQRQSRSALA